MRVTPFLTFVTPTYRRPAALAACLASVGSQTAADRLEHLVLPDHVGVGIGAMYARLVRVAPAVCGRYVHILADDDVLAGPTVVAELEQRARDAGDPPVLLVTVAKGGAILPYDAGAPVCGQIDLGCLVVRRDVWQAHVDDYGQRYEGDFDFAAAVWADGYRFHDCTDLLFMTGAVSHGRPEVAA